jgi:hypothetical protein
MIPKKSRFDKGQSIVIVALIMLALVGLTALALDGGYAFWERRIAQNAADAGAIAGAHELCSKTSNPQVNSVASSYVVKNKALVSDVSWSTASKTVSVTTNLSFDSFFAGVIGYDVITVTAKAVAKCSPTCDTEGVLPVAWSCKPPVEGSELPPDFCQLKFWDQNTTCDFGDPDYYVVADSSQISKEIVCADPVPPFGGVGPTPTATATPSSNQYNYVDCDLNDDGVNDVKILSGGSKVWLDLTGQSGGSDITNWVKYGYPGSVTVHTWYPGESGVQGSTFQAVFDYHEGQDVVIPIFDYIYNAWPNTASNTNWHASLDDCVPRPCTPNQNVSKDYFHVIAFAGFRVACVTEGQTGNTTCPGQQFLIDLGVNSNSLKTIEGCFHKDTGYGYGTTSSGSCKDTGSYAVQLVK